MSIDCLKDKPCVVRCITLLYSIDCTHDLPEYIVDYAGQGSCARTKKIERQYSNKIILAQL